MMNAGKKLPAQFKGNGALSNSVKDKLDEILENVSIANDGAPVVILGTRTGLQQFNKLIEVDWISTTRKILLQELADLDITDHMYLWSFRRDLL